ncbi:ras-related protein Rab-24-like isoform X1 [Acanthaster planci]|uniref:Ras-related protein Rab-24-like isoform X1 n=1 Tax=Acanthaster planci TaxID=133434 RepID=A0A8B7Y2G5_ACAPL|nr:ras-related protein Rab-24-like isoform X1 [Acanthaster planci]XP_022086491.1 ras-related protein Rab-24-like isoform X1 [Acanthaster planci]XP_022086492.1 ras-related protein Rab-24-like isoform X1 [Acanthaster planci]
MRRLDFKVVLLGNTCGGKTCLMERYYSDRFMEAEATIGVAYCAKEVKVDKRKLVMGIWDTAGQEKYTAVSRLYYRGAQAAVLCYDLTNPTSFDKVRFWLEEVKKSEEFCKIYLCGTKLDLVEEGREARQVDSDFVAYYADEFCAEVFETSSKTGYNVKELFFKIASDFAYDTTSEHLEDFNNKRKCCCYCPS